MNLQTLIDREIILDTLIQNFTVGDSLVQYAMQLWFLILKTDLDKPIVDDSSKAGRILGRANMLQMVVCRMCLFFDKLLILERIAQKNDAASMFKNVLTYSYNSHLILCWLVLQRIPQDHNDNKWYVFLNEVTKQKLQVSTAIEAVQLLQSNNDNVQICIKNLIKQSAVRQGFFETVVNCLS